MKKSLILLTTLIVLAIPIFVKAGSAEKEIIIDVKVKYLKTVTEYANVVRDEYGNIASADVVSDNTYEITEEEYNNADLENAIVTRASTTIQTTYKLMTTYLTYSNGKYHYKNQVNWLNFPAVRSYDVIAIGHYGNVEADGTPYCSMDYITSSGSHLSGSLAYRQNFTYGNSCTVLLPLQNLTSLTVTFEFDVKKVNPNTTIYSQAAFGDYAHGIDSSLTLSEALNHVVNQNAGIVFSANVSNKFDTINEAAVYWSGTW